MIRHLLFLRCFLSASPVFLDVRCPSCNNRVVLTMYKQCSLPFLLEDWLACCKKLFLGFASWDILPVASYGDENVAETQKGLPARC